MIYTHSISNLEWVEVELTEEIESKFFIYVHLVVYICEPNFTYVLHATPSRG